jgi:hypothetical protein
MVKTCKVKVDKDTRTVEYDDEEYENLICELISAKEGRNQVHPLQGKVCIKAAAKLSPSQRL